MLQNVAECCSFQKQIHRFFSKLKPIHRKKTDTLVRISTSLREPSFHSNEPVFATLMVLPCNMQRNIGTQKANMWTLRTQIGTHRLSMRANEGWTQYINTAGLARVTWTSSEWLGYAVLICSYHLEECVIHPSAWRHQHNNPASTSRTNTHDNDGAKRMCIQGWFVHR